jgi:hypothetical protein
VNENGHSESLRPFDAGNLAAVKHGVFSERALAPRAQEIAHGLLAFVSEVGTPLNYSVPAMQATTTLLQRGGREGVDEGPPGRGMWNNRGTTGMQTGANYRETADALSRRNRPKPFSPVAYVSNLDNIHREGVNGFESVPLAPRAEPSL